MIFHLRGKLAYKSPTELVIEVNGIGYRVYIPLSSFEQVGEVGDEVMVFTHLHVREDLLKLYGFVTEEEREIFQMLISVSGVGPRTAQGILSGITVSEFRRAIVEENLGPLLGVPGVGRKTAQRLIVELKEELTRRGLEPATPARKAKRSVQDEAILALLSLGYKRGVAKQTVDRIMAEADEELSVEGVIKRALRCM